MGKGLRGVLSTILDLQKRFGNLAMLLLGLLGMSSFFFQSLFLTLRSQFHLCHTRLIPPNNHPNTLTPITPNKQNLLKNLYEMLATLLEFISCNL